MCIAGRKMLKFIRLCVWMKDGGGTSFQITSLYHTEGLAFIVTMETLHHGDGNAVGGGQMGDSWYKSRIKRMSNCLTSNNVLARILYFQNSLGFIYTSVRSKVLLI